MYHNLHCTRWSQAVQAAVYCPAAQQRTVS